MLTATTTAAAVPTIFIAAEEVFNAVTGEAAVIAYFFAAFSLISKISDTFFSGMPS